MNKSLRKDFIYPEFKVITIRNRGKKMQIIVCPNCQYRNKISGRVKGRTCKKCGFPLDLKADKAAKLIAEKSAAPSKPAKLTKKELKAMEQQKLMEKYSGEFKQFGILCTKCRAITPFKNKRCQACKAKLKVMPTTTVYYNGKVEAIICPNCQKHTDAKLLKCEHCGKKLKF